MPIPESDEEIMASWSPQEWGFHAWEERNSEKILETQSQDAGWDAHSKLIKHAWPDPDDRRKYLERTPSSFNAIHRKGGHLMATIPSATGDMHANTFDSCPQDFVFAQLGLLWTFTGDWKKALHRNPNDDKRGRWNPTGFAVVVRLNPKGELGKVYALRHPDVVPQLERIEDDLIESRKPKANKKTAHKRGLYILKHYKPGHPHPKSDSSFSIAKIANSILELGSYKRQFDFEVLLSNEPQIVNAKMWVHGLDGPALMPVCEPDEIDI
ncbi:Uncharacterized protein LW93_6206 [Fusarium fujikuroi]|nr:Uncharacterized protein LW93_6206 [Fusarium fujikuroi]